MTNSLNILNSETKIDFALQIEHIIKQRHIFAKNIEVAQNNVEQLLLFFHNLSGKQSDLKLLDQNKDLAKLQNFDFENLITRLKQEQTQLAKLNSRFARKTLNIAVVGGAGQGKSRLLQTLTGLSSDIIPDGEGSDCTAVRSNIYHRRGLGDTVDIRVKYHHEESFFQDVILPYYQELKITPLPKSLAEFSTFQFDDNSAMNQVDTDKYEHLKTYRDRLSDYRHLLDRDSQSQPKINITQAELRDYITQDNSDSDKCDRLAVREVDIFCSFPKSNVGSISFVDMPGLGDGKINNYSSLLHTLGEDIDFVLFVRMPGRIYRQTNDIDSAFYDLADSAICDLPIKQWSYYVVNYYPQLGNELGCHKFQTKVKQKDIVADAVIANCANPQEVTQKILAPVLDYLTKNLHDLDRQYAEECQQKLTAIQTDIQAKIQQVFTYVRGETIGNFGDFTNRYTNLFNQLYEDLHTQLSQEARAISNANQSENTQLAEFIQQAIDNSDAENKVPSVEKLAEEVQKLSFAEVFPQQLRILHANINKPFNQVDRCLGESLEAAKGRIVKLLCDRGRLEEVVFKNSSKPTPEFKSADDFFDSLLAAIPTQLQVDKLKSAIATIKNATISYEAEIKEILDKYKHHLDPDKTTYQLTSKSRRKFQLIPKEFKITPEHLRKTIIQAHTAVINDSQSQLLKLAADPNKKLANMIETFVEEAFLDDENGRVKDDWRKFLSYYTAEVWPDEFGTEAKDLALKKEWRRLLESIDRVNQLSLI